MTPLKRRSTQRSAQFDSLTSEILCGGFLAIDVAWIEIVARWLAAVLED